MDFNGQCGERNHTKLRGHENEKNVDTNTHVMTIVTLQRFVFLILFSTQVEKYKLSYTLKEINSDIGTNSAGGRKV